MMLFTLELATAQDMSSGPALYSTRMTGASVLRENVQYMGWNHIMYRENIVWYNWTISTSRTLYDTTALSDSVRQMNIVYIVQLNILYSNYNWTSVQQEHCSVQLDHQYNENTVLYNWTICTQITLH